LDDRNVRRRFKASNFQSLIIYQVSEPTSIIQQLVRHINDITDFDFTFTTCIITYNSLKLFYNSQSKLLFLIKFLMIKLCTELLFFSSFLSRELKMSLKILLKRTKIFLLIFQNISKEHKTINSFLEPKEFFFLLSFFKETRVVFGDQIHKSRC
jgi:hypothetical protein